MITHVKVLHDSREVLASEGSESISTLPRATRESLVNDSCRQVPRFADSFRGRSSVSPIGRSCYSVAAEKVPQIGRKHTYLSNRGE